LILASEFLKFSHLNLAVFGGHSWATWVYPVLVSLSFGFFSKLLKIGNSKYVFLISLFVFVIIFYFMLNGSLFINFIPFGR